MVLTDKSPKDKNRKPTRNATQRSKQFHMDYEFFRGPKHLTNLTTRTWHGKRWLNSEAATDYRLIITNHDGYSIYLLIVDAFTRATFVFFTKSKSPPIQTITMFLDKNFTKDTVNMYILTGKGGELAWSMEFQKTVQKFNYVLEPTGTDKSSQNGRGKRPIKPWLTWSDTSCTAAPSESNSGATPSSMRVTSWTEHITPASIKFLLKPGEEQNQTSLIWKLLADSHCEETYPPPNQRPYSCLPQHFSTFHWNRKDHSVLHRQYRNN